MVAVVHACAIGPIVFGLIAVSLIVSGTVVVDLQVLINLGLSLRVLLPLPDHGDAINKRWFHGMRVIVLIFVVLLVDGLGIFL